MTRAKLFKMAQKMQTYDETRFLKRVTPEHHRNPNVERKNSLIVLFDEIIIFSFLTAQAKSRKKTIPKVFCWSWACVE